MAAAKAAAARFTWLDCKMLYRMDRLLPRPGQPTDGMVAARSEGRLWSVALGPVPGSTGGGRRASPHPLQTRVDRFLSSPQRVDVGAIGGEAGRHLGTLGDGAVAGDHDIDVAGGLIQPVERRLVGAH